MIEFTRFISPNVMPYGRPIVKNNKYGDQLWDYCDKQD